MRRQKKWTADEIALLKTDMSNADIAQETGRSIDSVRKKRFEVTGHYTTVLLKRDAYKKTTQVNAEYLDQVAKEGRIIVLAKRLGVRIKGVR